MPFVTGVLGGRGDLASMAQLLHALCFDPIELDRPRLSYEARWSAQCAKCAALWIASKAGKVMRIDLRVARPGDRPSQRWIPDEDAGHQGAVRTMCHVHHGSGLGDGSFLLLGRDSGTLDIVADRPRGDNEPAASFHLQTWHEDGGGERRRVSEGYTRPGAGADHLIYTAGVTAIAAVAARQQPGSLHILVATRYPRLYVIEACAEHVHLQAVISMPGWIDWIICGDDAGPSDGPLEPSGRITCISRAGHIVRFTYSELLAGDRGRWAQLSLLPTAAMPFAGHLLLGTATGLFLVRDKPQEGTEAQDDEAIALPVTRSPVLCLDRTALRYDCELGPAKQSVHNYVTMGLEDGRLRVIDTDLLNRLAAGDQRPTPRLHNFAIEMNSAVMAVETLRPDDAPGNAAFVMAVLGDHSVRLFQVTSQHAQRTRFEGLWTAHVAPRMEARTPGASAVQHELTAARAPAPEGCSDDAWVFALIDVVLTRLRRLAGESGNPRHMAEVHMLTCELARRADRRGLYQFSTMIDELCDHDVDSLLPLSRAVLSAVPPGEALRWRLVIDRHLRDLNTVSVRDDQRPRLVAWTRFVRKYVLLGHTFTAKRSQLRELVEQNYQARKYLDALIYQVRLAQRRYDIRWDGEVEEEVAELHTVRCGGMGTVVVVITVDAKLAVFDHDGSRLRFADPAITANPNDRTGSPCETLAPFNRKTGARTLASAAVPRDGGFRVVLSCTLVPDAQDDGISTDAGQPRLPERQPRLIVIDVSPPGDRSDARQLTAQIAQVNYRGCRDEVHAIRPLPDRADTFVVGLATDIEPVGRLRWSPEQRWELESFRDCAAPAPGPDGPADMAPRTLRAPSKMPTRALAVANDESAAGYLAVAGSDDGFVRVVAFGRDAIDAAWTVDRWDRVNDVITSVMLGPHPSNRSVPDVSSGDQPGESLLFSCYLGTASGDSFALSIGPRSRSTTAVPVAGFGPHVAEPLWREALDGPILATRLWRTPLFRAEPQDGTNPEPAEILAIVTEKGRLSIYNHASGANRSKPRVSTQSNYYFRGMRLDRVVLAEQLRAVAVIDGSADLVMASPHGKLTLVRLAYLFNSVELENAEAGSESRNDLANPRGDLPETMPARQDHLFLKSVHDVPFRAAPTPGSEPTRPGDDASVELKHELCNLVRIEGGALSHYILDRTWSDRERWDRLDLAILCDRLHAHLNSLDPENAEHAARIKLVLKGACRAHLRRDPDAYREQLVTQPAKAIERPVETAAICEIVAAYLTRKLAYATRAAARLRIVAIKELLRVPVLRHIARDKQDTRVRDAIASALDACLRDDNRLVRIETLRALWVMLRNVSVMAELSSDRRALLAALFPDGLGSLEWLLDRLISGLLRAPSFTRRSSLIGIAWFHVSVLLPLFRIFSDHALALSHHLLARGLGLEVVAMCVHSLRDRDAAELRRRLHHLYLLQVVDTQARDTPYSRDEFIELYKVAAQVPGDAAAAPRATERPWYELDDTALGGELAQLLDRLARMWEAGDDRQMLEPVHLVPGSPYAAIGQGIDELAQIARDLPQLANPGRPRPTDDEARSDAELPDPLERLAELGARYRSSIEGAPALTGPIRAVLSEIIKTWQWICSPPSPGPGTEIRKVSALGDAVVLDAPVVEGGSVFRLREPARWRDSHVVKVFAKRNHPGAARRFLDAARLTQYLVGQARHGDARYFVEIEEILSERPYHAYVMRQHGQSLAVRLGNGTNVVDRMAWADHAARQLGRAVQRIHDLSGYHGSIKLSNIFVDLNDPDRDPVFHLGGLAHDDETHDRSLPSPGIPEPLRRKCETDNDLARRQWGDVVALSWVLYQVLDGAPLKPIPSDPLRELDLDRWNTERRVGLKRVLGALKEVFDPGRPSLGIDEFLAILTPVTTRTRPPPPRPPHQLRILHLSDLHHRGPREHDQARRTRVLGNAWWDNLRELRTSGAFDLVVFTGDVAFSGKPDEYSELVEPRAEGTPAAWLDRTLEAVGCTRRQLYIVPGNHDIDRAVNRDAWQTLRDTWRGASQGFSHELAQWFVRGHSAPGGIARQLRDQVLARQAAYRAWVTRRLGRPELAPNPERSHLGYRHTIRLPGRPFDVHLIGFDSAWLAGDEHDARQLRLTEDQILQLCTNEGDPLPGLRIAMVHHPLAELADGELAHRRLREYGIHLLLSGHLHDPEARELTTPDGGLRDLATGCLFEHDRYRNACTALTLELSDSGAICELELWFRTWSNRGHWHNDNSLYRDTVNGRLRLRPLSPDCDRHVQPSNV